MDYIVFDMEWNQAGYGRPMIREPLPLEGEIIQIGALRLNENFEPAGEFKINIRPRVYRRMNRKVQQITRIKTEELASGADFEQAMDTFRDFCGGDFCFVTWGSDDMRVLRQNLAYKKADAQWLPEKHYDLQLVFDRDRGNKNESSLAAALEACGIALDIDRPQHDALNDAYYTALLCRRLDLRTAMEQYSSLGTPRRAQELCHDELGCLTSRSKAMKDERLLTIACPACGGTLTLRPWAEHGGGRYISLASCEQDGGFSVRMRFRRAADGTLIALRSIFAADESSQGQYERRAAAAQLRPKRRSHRRRPSEGAQEDRQP